ncbi:hypothetical protein GSI_04290 [Ganoderma sinense ZZ0214-1]|uniref:Uncharacterized protein n=1 Tax=Ganoderma sinense ZZ0214-1 TaxID=1077348 RepID=A0A2G8SIW7_9APHY|nr:hypothetical protein GSI_04290 [Ganoderma sinense ZZ0214-1]
MIGITDDGVVPEHELRQWLDAKYAQQVSDMGDLEIPIARAREFLDSPGGVTGCKPHEGTPNVFIRAIPDCDYSLRLFPGNIALQEYCADFVRASTGQPANCPKDFELWSAPTGPSGLTMPSGRLLPNRQPVEDGHDDYHVLDFPAVAL